MIQGYLSIVKKYCQKVKKDVRPDEIKRNIYY